MRQRTHNQMERTEMDADSHGSVDRRIVDLSGTEVRGGAYSSDRCEICSGAGLAILPVRYTIVPSSFPGAGTGRLGGGKANRQDVGSAGYHYALRTLRQGMLYIFYENGGPYGANAWEAYAVAENGTLWKQPTAEGAALIVGGGLPTCRRDSHDPLRTEYIVIRQPEACASVWLAFSQYSWTPDVLDRYATDSGLRRERMQPIDPASWMKNPRSAQDTCPLENENDLAAVLEYGLYPGDVTEPSQLPHLAKAKRISNSENFDWYELKANATRYPWAMRNDSAMTADDSLAALGNRFRHIRSSSYIESEGYQTIVPPMLIGLWDPIGVAHELNGFRHDVIGKMEQYRDEQKMKFGAAERIGQISTILQSNAAVFNARYFEYGRAEFEKMKSENGEGWAEDYAPFLNSDAYWQDVERSFLPVLQEKARKEWEEKCKPRIDRRRLDEFMSRTEEFNKAAIGLLENRSEALGRILHDPLLHIVLEDYDGHDLPAGVAFDEVISDAIESLGVDRVGQGVLEGLVSNADVTSRSSLIWRSIALNQSDGRDELKEVLKAADAAREQSLVEGTGGWRTFVEASSKLKKFVGYYKNFEAAQKEVVPTTAANRLLRESGIDRLVVTCGALIMKSWGIKHIQDEVGGALIRFILATRALMNPAEVSNLIQIEAAKVPEMRNYFYQRVIHYRNNSSTAGSPMMYALRDLENHKASQILQRRWESAAESSRSAVRLASLTGVLEFVNFANLILKSDKAARDYGSLVASGASVLSIYAGLSVSVSKELLSEGSRSVGKMKAVGGLLGTAGTTIGVFYDSVDTFNNYNEKNYDLAFLHGIKAFAGATVGGAQFLTALSYSAPVLRSAFGGRSGVVLLEGLNAGISAAAQKVAARGAGTVLAQADRIVATEAMKRLGLWILRVGTWEVTLVIAAVQGLIWAMEPSALEKWCKQNEFGASNSGFKSYEEQEFAFIRALGSVGVRRL